MTGSYRIPLIVLALLAGTVAAAAAQTYNRCRVTAWGEDTRISYSMDWEMVNPPPAEFVGWTIVRHTVGICEDDVIVCPTFPFPTEPVVATQWDTDVQPGVTYRYRLMAVDNEGELGYLDTSNGFPPGFRQIGYGSLDDMGAVAAGVIVDPATGHRGFVICPDSCWKFISFLADLPPDLEPAVLLTP